MDYSHSIKIVETYQKLLKLTGDDKPNRELLDVVINIYTYAYNAGEHEESERVHWFYPELINKEELLKECHEGDQQ